MTLHPSADARIYRAVRSLQEQEKSMTITHRRRVYVVTNASQLASLLASLQVLEALEVAA